MDATVCIPWRPQPDRLQAYARIMAFWKHHDIPVVEADSTPGLPFSLAEARNNAVRQATTDVVIVADADTIPDIGRVYQACEMDGVVWPFTKYRHIAPEWVERADLMSAPVKHEYLASVGGILVAKRHEYWRLGGMDDRFERCWGYEDNAFHAVVETLSTAHRLPGVIFSFDHTAERDMTRANPNWPRAQLYRLCKGKPHLMRELIKR